MMGFMFGLSMAASAVAAGTFLMASTTIGQLIGAVVGVGGCVLFAGSAIVDSIEKLHPPKPKDAKPAKLSEIDHGG